MASKPTAKMRYLRTHIALSVLYLALVALASYFVPDDAAPTPGVILWGLLPGLVIVGWIWNMGRYLLEMEDEYLRMLETRKALIATGLTLAICGGWGLVELFAQVPRLPMFFVFPIWCLGLAVGEIANKVTSGSDGGCS
ncbi:hypothetical protein [Erythrobacter mangrovi]|uniref:Transmembrane protein n=1 Tax=Erythrobacter mangrovi TaxID=2739433 RepID=A0A7D4B963_9SPHN|nr:hypothetical protein [Erythrobacter mangrovi]QKG70801.1 hypothetical protein HQR01_05120 [Erythrobacter mangrovi]